MRAFDRNYISVSMPIEGEQHYMINLRSALSDHDAALRLSVAEASLHDSRNPNHGRIGGLRVPEAEVFPGVRKNGSNTGGQRS